ncbi:hypothetical protein HDF14_003916 [Edaphobacter lichenicola]|uniref:Uncharacterized protein n=1 Tax=Tunturiibacter gelidiferens TaxID=3069689 RepID=A0A9X0QHH1_9BACT|nr:hypothetical protein [Edaphobacter lichenicola]
MSLEQGLGSKRWTKVVEMLPDQLHHHLDTCTAAAGFQSGAATL